MLYEVLVILPVGCDPARCTRTQPFFTSPIFVSFHTVGSICNLGIADTVGSICNLGIAESSVAA